MSGHNAFVNCYGRVPPCDVMPEGIEMEKRLYGEEGYFHRTTGKFRGTLVCHEVNSSGVKIRIDSPDVPELWIEGELPWADIRNMAEIYNVKDE